LAPGASSSQSEPFCTAEWLNEEPDMGKPFVRFCEGMRHNWCMAEIMWHRRETRRQTENTNIMPGALEGLILLDKNSCGLSLVVFEQPAKPFTTVQRAISFAFWARRRKEQDIALALMIALLMVMVDILVEHMP
jgi:hypothetical protein